MFRELDKASKSQQNFHPFKADVGSSNDLSIEDESMVVFEDRKSLIKTLFYEIFTQLAQPTYACHFYQTLCKEIAKHNFDDPKLFKILDTTFKNISPLDIEQFLYYDSDVAL